MGTNNYEDPTKPQVLSNPLNFLPVSIKIN